ncbi:MAG TPA: DUF6682 family protein [Pseudoxanthomonas sp.]
MEALTLEKLLANCREELDDEVPPYLYKDAALTKYLNEAVHEVAVRTRCLVESERTDMCVIQLQPGVATYLLHPSVVIVRRAYLASRPEEALKRTSSTHLQQHHCNWRTEQGAPRFLVRDRQQRKITLSPVPEVADTLRLELWRVPADDEVMESMDDEPVVDPLHHHMLFRWACFRAFNRKDSEQQDTTLADRNLTMFEAHFGTAPTASELQNLQIDSLSGTSPVWF